MKKSRILGYALTLAATMVVGGAMGQVQGGADFVLSGTDVNADNNASGLVTRGGVLHLFVQPDLAYSPNYNATGSWAIPADHTWSWTLPAKFTSGNGTAPADRPNYVEITAAADAPLGKTKLTVEEKLPAAFAACPATARDYNIFVVEKPSVTFDQTTAIALGTACTVPATHTVKLKVKATSDKIAIAMTLDVRPVTFNAATNVMEIGANDGTHTSTVISATKTQISAAPWSVATTTAFDYTTSSALGDYVVSYTKGGHPIVGTDKVTLYRYKFVAGQGVNDDISRKSYGTVTHDADITKAATFAEGTTLFNGDAATLDIYVVAPPKTGPVYHIKNNIAI